MKKSVIFFSVALFLLVFQINFVQAVWTNMSDGFKTTSAGAASPDGIATNGTDFWITDYNAFIYHVKPNGAGGSTNYSDGFNTSTFGSTRPSGIATNGSDFWITDYNLDNFVYHVKPNGAGGSINYTDGFKTLAFGSDSASSITTNGSDFWITDSYDDFVYHVKPNGAGGSINYTDGFKTLAFGSSAASGIATNGTDFWVADETDNFVYHVKPNGAGGSTNYSDGFSTTAFGVGFTEGIATNYSVSPTDFWIVDGFTGDDFVYHIRDVVASGTIINGCTNITSAGNYLLDSNIYNWNGPSNQICMKITSSDVMLDCQGNTIDGMDRSSTIGIKSEGQFTSQIRNVTVKNCRISDWEYGINYIYTQNSTIQNITATSNSQYGGIRIDNSARNNITDINAFDNLRGLTLWNGANYNTFRNINSSNNSVDGILLWTANGNNILNSNFSGNGVYGIWIFEYSENNTLSNIEVGKNLERGVRIENSRNNSLKNVRITKNIGQSGLFVYSDYGISYNRQDIDTSNTVNGKAVQFYDGLYRACPNGASISYPSGSYVSLIGCNNVDLMMSNTDDIIYLYSTNYSTIRNTTATNSVYGVMIYNSHNNNLTNITAAGNTLDGISVRKNSMNNVLKDINSSNNKYGITFDTSNKTNVTDSYLSNNSMAGIYLVVSSYNDIQRITSVKSPQYGVYLWWDCDYNTFKTVTSSGNIAGVMVTANGDAGCNYNQFEDITVLNNLIYGINLAYSHNNSLKGTNVTNTTSYGIILSQSNGNNISNFYIARPGTYSLYLQRSNYTIIDNITVFDAFTAGINLEYGYKNVIMNSTIINNNQYGISMYYSSYNNITRNIIQNSSYPSYGRGIYIESLSVPSLINSSKNTIWDNIINNTKNIGFGGINNTNYFSISQISGKNIKNGTWIGGNFWASPSNNGFSQTCSDTNYDGLCDSTFVINSTYAVDFLPLSSQTPNNPPTIPQLKEILPVIAYSDSLLSTGAENSTDAEGNPITYWYQWNNSLDSAIMKEGRDNITLDCNLLGCNTGDTIKVYAKATTSFGNSSYSAAQTKIITISPFGNHIPAWTHVAVTYNKNTRQKKIYVNGNIVRTETLSGTTYKIYNNSFGFYVGKIYGISAGNFLNGSIDEILITPKAKSPEELMQSYQNDVVYSSIPWQNEQRLIVIDGSNVSEVTLSPIVKVGNKEVTCQQSSKIKIPNCV